MRDPDAIPDSQPQRDPEYQDFHFHDDDEIIPADDVQRRRSRPPLPRKSNRRPLPRRRFEED